MSSDRRKPERLSLVHELASRPLFQLSTAGMELFHSNMLYWLAHEKPGESQPVWRALGLDEGAALEGFDVRREWRHLDLVVRSRADGTALVIENKIGAVPTAEQLHRYSAILSQDPTFASTSVRPALLTVTRPQPALLRKASADGWRDVLYGDLVPALRETVANLRPADKELVSSYADLVDGLSKLAAVYDPIGHPDEPMSLDADERTALAESRISSLVEKIRATRLAALIEETLFKKSAAPPRVAAGISNGAARVDWFVKGPQGRHFGWQIQNAQFRRAVITGKRDPKPRAAREDLVKRLFSDLFDFTVPPELPAVLTEYAGRKEWLGFEPDFVYRYAALDPSTTWSQVASLAHYFTEQTALYVRNQFSAT